VGDENPDDIAPVGDEVDPAKEPAAGEEALGEAGVP